MNRKNAENQLDWWWSTSRSNIGRWANSEGYDIIDQIHRKRYLWTFQKFVKKLTQIVKNQLLSGGLFDLEALEEEIAILENKMTEPDFWDDNIAAQKTSQELNELKQTYENFHQMVGRRRFGQGRIDR